MTPWPGHSSACRNTSAHASRRNRYDVSNVPLPWNRKHQRLPSSRAWSISIVAGHEQALSALDAAPRDNRSRALRQHLRGDALHNLGRLLDASAAYSEAVRLSGNDPVLSSKLGYTEVRLGRTREGITRLKQAAEKAPEVAEIRERLMKAPRCTEQPGGSSRPGGKIGQHRRHCEGIPTRREHPSACEARRRSARNSQSRGCDVSRVRGTPPGGG